MKLLNFCFVLAFLASSASTLQADTIALWNFNDAAPGVTGGAAEFGVDYGIGSMTSSFIAANIGNLSGTSINSSQGDPAGRALRLQGGAGTANNGEHLSWYVGTAGYDNLEVSFATRSTSTGFDSNQFQYSIDAGAGWIDFGPAYRPGTGYGLQRFDLSPVEELNNNPLAGFRIVFDGASTASGNNRIDNVIVSGEILAASIPIPEPATSAMVGLGLLGIGIFSRLKRC
jgi:hypothetical protein